MSKILIDKKELSFEEIKKIELEILEEFALFCNKNNLKYFLAYGTLIGAVRHKGFIPWDDDIDVQMPRDDYNRLIKIFNDNKSSDNLELVAPTDIKSRHSFVKIIDNRTIKIEKSFEYSDGFLGADIDVFPLDGQPEKDRDFKQWYKRLHRIYYLYLLCTLDENATITRKIVFPIVRLLTGGKKRLLKKAEKLHKEYPYEDSKYVGSVESAYDFEKTNRIEKKHYSSSVMLDFEGKKYSVPIGYHEILTLVYGNYMKLPPKDEQITHHKNKIYWK